MAPPKIFDNRSVPVKNCQHNSIVIYSATTPTKATRQKVPQIYQINIAGLTKFLEQINFVIKLYITKATDLWSCWIIC